MYIDTNSHKNAPEKEEEENDDDDKSNVCFCTLLSADVNIDISVLSISKGMIVSIHATFSVTPNR